MKQPLGRGIVIPLLSVLLAIFAAAVVWPRFDGLYGQDSFSYFNYSRGPLDEALRRGQLPPPFFWPPGYPLLIWLAMGLVGMSPLAGQLVALLAGALVPILTALFARELFVLMPPAGRPGAGAGRYLKWLPVLAGLLVALQGQLWQSSVVVMSDTPSLAAGTAGLWLAARWWRRRRLPTLCLAAGLLAFALLTRWAFGLVAIPVTAYVLLELAVPAGKDGAESPAGHSPFLQAAAAGAVVLLVLCPLWLPAAADLFAGKPAAEVAFAGDLAVYRWSPLNALRRTFTTTDGQLNYRLPNGLYYALAPAHRYFFTPMLALFLLPGFGALWRLRNRARLWLVVGWTVAVAGFHAGAPWQNFRFTLVYLPPLAIVAALGIVVTWRWLGRWSTAGGRGLKILLGAYILVGFGAMAWGGAGLTRFFVERKEAELATVSWVEAQTPPEAQVLAFNMTFTLDHYSSREVHHLFYQTPATVADLVATGRPTFLLLEVDSFIHQWAGHRSERSFRWLQEEVGLVALGRQRQYVLYEVGRD